MKKIFVWALGAGLLMSSCSTTTQGAYTGGSFGTILGSAIGGILGGPRGSDVGTIVGMAGGAVFGAAVGKANEKAAVEEHYERMQANRANGYNPYATDTDTYSRGYYDDTQGGFDPNNAGDDRLYDFTPGLGSDEVAVDSAIAIDDTPNIELRNVHFEDANHDGVLGRGETGTVVFEVINRGNKPLDNLEPTVVETTGNRHVAISQPIRVERVMPGKGVRYTATVRASGRVKNGSVCFLPVVMQYGSTIGQSSSITVTTRR